MKKTVIWLIVILFCIPIIASAKEGGVGINGGLLFPIVQEDQESGYVIGFKIRAKLIGPLAFEPNFNTGGFGDVTLDGIGTQTGSDLKYYGLDITLGGGMGAVGPKPYFFIGGGVYNTKRNNEQATNESGWSFGPGLAIGFKDNIDLDIRGRVNIASAQGSITKKSFALTFGLVYFFGEKLGGE